MGINKPRSVVDALPAKLHSLSRYSKQKFCKKKQIKINEKELYDERYPWFDELWQTQASNTKTAISIMNQIFLPLLRTYSCENYADTLPHDWKTHKQTHTK